MGKELEINQDLIANTSRLFKLATERQDRKWQGTIRNNFTSACFRTYAGNVIASGLKHGLVFFNWDETADFYGRRLLMRSKVDKGQVPQGLLYSRTTFNVRSVYCIRMRREVLDHDPLFENYQKDIKNFTDVFDPECQIVLVSPSNTTFETKHPEIAHRKLPITSFDFSALAKEIWEESVLPLSK